MVTDVYPMVAEESSVANPQKVAKIDENIRKMRKKLVGNTVFAEELPDSSVLSVFIDVIGSIGVIDWLSGTIGGIGVRPDILPTTGSKVSIGYPRTSASNKRGRIESYCHRLRSATECPRLRNYHFYKHISQIVPSRLPVCIIHLVQNLDAQSFSNFFEGVHGVVRKSGRGSSIFVFYCIFMLQFFKVFWGGTWVPPLSRHCVHLWY